MTQKDKLLELLDGIGDDIAFCDICDRPTDDCKACKNEQLADYLLANGVIIPPCKVGDTVYFDTYLRGKNVGIQPHKVIKVNCVLMTEPSKGGIGAEISDWDFGETVFLTREEAEKALKERAQK